MRTISYKIKIKHETFLKQDAPMSDMVSGIHGLLIKTCITRNDSCVYKAM